MDVKRPVKATKGSEGSGSLVTDKSRRTSHMGSQRCPRVTEPLPDRLPVLSVTTYLTPGSGSNNSPSNVKGEMSSRVSASLSP